MPPTHAKPGASAPTPSPRPGPAPSPPVQQAKDGTKVKVLTINVKGFQGSDGGQVDRKAYDAIDRYIEKVDPDVVLFQELDAGTARAHRDDQLAEIARRVDATDSQFGTAIDGFEGGRYGVGMVTRHGFHIRDAAGGGNATTTVHLPKGTAPGADGEQRVALVAPVVAPDGHEFTAVATHVTVKGPGRSGQIEQLRSVVGDVRGGAADRSAGLPDDLPSTVVLGGDFNTTRDNVEQHLGSQVTHVGARDWSLGDTGIDHIFVSDDVAVADTRLDDPATIHHSWVPIFGGDDVHATDHPALEATLLLR